MHFTTGTLIDLMETPRGAPQAAAEQANLSMEGRVSIGRHDAYEGRVGRVTGWDDWRERHLRYVREEVRRRYPLSAAFSPGEPSLRPGVEPNQYLLRVERIDGLLRKYFATTGKAVDVDEVNRWITATRGKNKTDVKTAKSLAGLGRLVSGTPASPAPSAIEDLTDLFNQERKDGRPSFVAFEAEFPDLVSRPDWARHICEHCGLAHHFVDGPVTLALFRYRVQEVLDAQPGTQGAATVFAVPTAIDQPFYNVFFPAPGSIPWGQAVGLVPEDDCAHLVAELIHARIDYQAKHWVLVGSLTNASLTDAEIGRLRGEHLRCLRTRPDNADYGQGC